MRTVVIVSLSFKKNTRIIQMLLHIIFFILKFITLPQRVFETHIVPQLHQFKKITFKLKTDHDKQKGIPILHLKCKLTVLSLGGG